MSGLNLCSHCYTIKLNMRICVEGVAVNAQTDINRICVASCTSMFIGMEYSTWCKIIGTIEVSVALMLRIQVILTSRVTDPWHFGGMYHLQLHVPRTPWPLKMVIAFLWGSSNPAVQYNNPENLNSQQIICYCTFQTSHLHYMSYVSQHCKLLNSNKLII